MILVTGGTGFIGREVVRQGLTQELPLSLLLHKRLAAGIEAVEGDLLDKDSLAKAVKGADTVIHLAAEVSPKNSADLFATNIEGTGNLIDAAEKAGCKRFIFISSMDAVHFCRTAYGQSKLAAEKLVSESPMETVIIRPSVVLPDAYNEEVKGAMGRILSWANRFKCVPLIGRGQQQLRYAYCSEVAQVILASASGSAIKGEPLEVYSDTATQKSLYAKVLEENNAKAVLIPVPLWVYRLVLGPIGMFKPSVKVFLQKIVLGSFDK